MVMAGKKKGVNREKAYDYQICAEHTCAKKIEDEKIREHDDLHSFDFVHSDRMRDFGKDKFNGVRRSVVKNFVKISDKLG
jgi:hypothetical protein